MAGLGRGLDALLSASREKQLRDANTNQQQHDLRQNGSDDITCNAERADKPTYSAHEESNTAGLTVEIDITQLIASRYQPRRAFNDDSLDDLASSIKTHGLLEPLLVMRCGDKYEIVCGERRFRASKIAGLQRVPCLIRDALAEDAYAMALIENIQREDLNPLELAVALQQMQQECGMTQERLAHTLGISRSTITNYLRLNNLDMQVREALADRLIDMGHAKAILGLDPEQQSQACKEIIKKDLSVRQTEIYIRRLKSKALEDSIEQKEEQAPEQFRQCEARLSSILYGVKVKFTGGGEGQGKITMTYSSKEQFDKIIEMLGLNDIIVS